MSREYSRNVSSADRAALEEQLLTDSMTRKAYHGVEIARGLEQDAYNKERRDAETAATNYNLETAKKREDARVSANLVFNTQPEQGESVEDTNKRIDTATNYAIASGVGPEEVKKLLGTSANAQLVDLYKNAENTATSVGMTFKGALEKATGNRVPVKIQDPNDPTKQIEQPLEPLTHQEQIALVTSYAGGIQQQLKGIPQPSVVSLTRAGYSPTQIVGMKKKEAELDDVVNSLVEKGAVIRKKEGATTRVDNYHDLRGMHTVTGSPVDTNIDALFADFNSNFEIVTGDGSPKSVVEVVKGVRDRKTLNSIAEPMSNKARAEAIEAEKRMAAAQSRLTEVAKSLEKATNKNDGTPKFESEEAALKNNLVRKLTEEQTNAEATLERARRNYERASDFGGAVETGISEAQATGELSKLNDTKVAVIEETKLIKAVEETAEWFKTSGETPESIEAMEAKLREFAGARKVDPKILDNYVRLMNHGDKTKNTAPVKSRLTHIDNLARQVKRPQQ